MSIDTTFTELEQSRSAWGGLYDLLVNGEYEVGGTRPSIEGQSVQSFAKRADLVFEGLLALRPSESDSAQASAVAGKAAEIRQAAQAFTAQATNLTRTLQSNWRTGLVFKDTNGSFATQVTQADGSAITNLDMSSSFQTMDTELGKLTTHFALLIPLFRAEGVGDLSLRATMLNDIVRDMSHLQEQAKRIAEGATASASTIDGKEKEAQSLVTQADALLVKIGAHQVQATTEASSVTTLVEKIKTIGAAADTLEKMVAGHTSSVDVFQQQLDARNADFDKFQADTKTARQTNSDREAEIDQLIKRADAMISGSTTAGLAKSMEDTRARYEVRMTGARQGFYVAVVVLVISAVPLVLHLVPGLLGAWSANAAKDTDGGMYGFVGRIFLLLPATWLTAFFAKSYASFFDLEREYAHKAALAMSVDGFKRQAPKYQEEITAEVFLEIQKNPGNGNTTMPVSHPLYDVLAKVVGKCLDPKSAEGKKA